LSAAQIATDPRSEHVTSWLGAGSPLRRAHVASFRASVPGVVVICSDGLWRYLPAVSDLVAALSDIGTRASAHRTAQGLVGLALAGGGIDNVTVAVVAVHPELEVRDE
jgi:serine/threonine protein phosphatase PrpC